MVLWLCKNINVMTGDALKKMCTCLKVFLDIVHNIYSFNCNYQFSNVHKCIYYINLEVALGITSRQTKALGSLSLTLDHFSIGASDLAKNG